MYMDYTLSHNGQLVFFYTDKRMIINIEFISWRLLKLKNSGTFTGYELRVCRTPRSPQRAYVRLSRSQVLGNSANMW